MKLFYNLAKIMAVMSVMTMGCVGLEARDSELEKALATWRTKAFWDDSGKGKLETYFILQDGSWSTNYQTRQFIDFEALLNKTSPEDCLDAVAMIDRMTAPRADKRDDEAWVFGDNTPFGQALLKLRNDLIARAADEADKQARPNWFMRMIGYGTPQEKTSDLEIALGHWANKDFSHDVKNKEGEPVPPTDIHIVTNNGEWSRSSAGHAKAWAGRLEDLLRSTPPSRALPAMGMIDDMVGKDKVFTKDSEFGRALVKARDILLQKAQEYQREQGERDAEEVPLLF